MSGLEKKILDEDKENNNGFSGVPNLRERTHNKSSIIDNPLLSKKMSSNSERLESSILSEKNRDFSINSNGISNGQGKSSKSKLAMEKYDIKFSNNTLDSDNENKISLEIPNSNTEQMINLTSDKRSFEAIGENLELGTQQKKVRVEGK